MNLNQPFLQVALPIMVTMLISVWAAVSTNNRRLDDFAARLGRIEDGTNARLGRIEDGLNARLGRIEDRLLAIENRLTALERKVDALEVKAWR